MATFAAARSFLRSSATRSAASRFTSATTTTAGKPKSNSNPFHFPKHKPLSSPRIFRSPVELSCGVESLLPYHTATASALLTSMLSVSSHRYGWTPEDG